MLYSGAQPKLGFVKFMKTKLSPLENIISCIENINKCIENINKCIENINKCIENINKDGTNGLS